jgi:hypothetical protein
MLDLLLAVSHHLLIFAIFGIFCAEFWAVRPGFAVIGEPNALSKFKSSAASRAPRSIPLPHASQSFNGLSYERIFMKDRAE